MPSFRSRIGCWWRKRVLGLIIAQLTQGFTPQKISLTIALGAILGIFPILGATSLLCGIAGVWLRLNQPVIQLVNWLVSPLQLTLILFFVRIGECLMHAQPVNISVPELIRKFDESPSKFFQEFGLTGLHGIVAWLVMAPFLVAMLYCLFLPPLKRLAVIQWPHAS